MDKIQGKDAQKFMVWLTMVSAFLPKNMSLEEAQSIFLRKRQEEKGDEKEKQ
ncbi:MAG TPA: hypothetical protein ACFYDZ_00195 [Candidatus Brocadiaceae bacterium]